ARDRRHASRRRAARAGRARLRRRGGDPDPRRGGRVLARRRDARADAAEGAEGRRDLLGSLRHERPRGDDRVVALGEGADLGRRPRARRDRRRARGPPLPRGARGVREGAPPGPARRALSLRRGRRSVAGRAQLGGEGRSPGGRRPRRSAARHVANWYGSACQTYTPNRTVTAAKTKTTKKTATSTSSMPAHLLESPGTTPQSALRTETPAGRIPCGFTAGGLPEPGAGLTRSRNNLGSDPRLLRSVVASRDTRPLRRATRERRLREPRTTRASSPGCRARALYACSRKNSVTIRTASCGHSTRSAWPMSGNSTSRTFGFSSAIRRAPSPDGARSGGQSTSWVPFVISSGREIRGTSALRSISSIARQACRTV